MFYDRTLAISGLGQLIVACDATIKCTKYMSDTTTFVYLTFMFPILFKHFVGRNKWLFTNVVLMQRPLAASKKSFLQDWLLAVPPCIIFCFGPALVSVFLWDSSSSQFAFALLPIMTARRSVIWELLPEKHELYCFTMWLALGHLGMFHCTVLLRVVQRELVDFPTFLTLMCNDVTLTVSSGPTRQSLPTQWIISEGTKFDSGGQALG